MADARDIVAELLDGAADTAGRISGALPGEAQAAVLVGAGVAKVVAELVRVLGVNRAKAVLEELKRRVDAKEGVITAEDLAEDDATIDALLDELYGAAPA